MENGCRKQQYWFNYTRQSALILRTKLSKTSKSNIRDSFCEYSGGVGSETCTNLCFSPNLLQNIQGLRFVWKGVKQNLRKNVQIERGQCGSAADWKFRQAQVKQLYEPWIS